MTGDDSTKKEKLKERKEKKVEHLGGTLTKPNTQKEPMDNLSQVSIS